MRTNFDKNIARLHFQGAEMVKAHEDKLNEEAIQEVNKKNDTLSEAAYLSIGSDIHTKRMRKQNAERALNYQEHFATVALTEALSDCVKESLLLNTDEYAKLNENYETEIHDTIQSFLENADINEDIKNKTILELYEAIIKEVPPADLYLTEEDEKMIVRQNILSQDSIKRGLESLCRDVKTRAANIVSKDQEEMVKQTNELDTIDQKELEKAPMIPPMEAPAEVENDVEVLPDPDAEQTQVDPVPNPEEVGQSINDAPIEESVNPVRIIKEKQKQGIVETLAMNEAEKMLAEGKEYDSTLALANALKYITILETLDCSGLVSIGTEGYNRILSASGVDMTPIKAVDIPGASIHTAPVCNSCQADRAETVAKVELPETKKEKDLRNKISEMVKDSMPNGLTVGKDLSHEIFKPYSEWKKEHSASNIEVFDTPAAPIMESVDDLKGKYTNMKGQVFTESELMTFFENQGFNLELSDFEDLWRSWNFKKH